MVRPLGEMRDGISIPERARLRAAAVAAPSRADAPWTGVPGAALAVSQARY